MTPAAQEAKHLVAQYLCKEYRFRSGEQLLVAPLTGAHAPLRFPGEYEIYLYSRDRPELPPTVTVVDSTGGEVEAATAVQRLGRDYRIVLRARATVAHHEKPTHAAPLPLTFARRSSAAPNVGLLEWIVSGGQTGADRAALDFAIGKGVAHGGWCPRSRRAEDGEIPARYRLQETPSRTYLQRTCWNVRDSDATVIFSIQPSLLGGTRYAFNYARHHNKPVLHLSAERGEGARELRAFLAQHKVRVLNVAGPRASTEPTVASYVLSILRETLIVKRAPEARRIIVSAVV